jgi:hypothetical protein
MVEVLAAARNNLPLHHLHEMLQLQAERADRQAPL